MAQRKNIITRLTSYVYCSKPGRVHKWTCIGTDLIFCFEIMQVDCAGNPLSVSAAAELTLELIIGFPQFPPRPVFGTKKNQSMVGYISGQDLR